MYRKQQLFDILIKQVKEQLCKSDSVPSLLKERMKQKTKNTLNDTINEIVPMLIIDSGNISNNGLFHGKMGIVLFFAHYGRYSGDKLYDQFAGKLLDEIYEDITTEMPVNLESGLCGIGWGVEYLVQGGFMKGNTDDILEEIDLRIMERDPRRIRDVSFRSGLGGIAFYVLARLITKRQEGRYPFDLTYIRDLQKALASSDLQKDKENPIDLVQDINAFLSGQMNFPYDLKLPSVLIEQSPSRINKKINMPMGIINGLSGFGLKNMDI